MPITPLYLSSEIWATDSTPGTQVETWGTSIMKSQTRSTGAGIVTFWSMIKKLPPQQLPAALLRAKRSTRGAAAVRPSPASPSSRLVAVEHLLDPGGLRRHGQRQRKQQTCLPRLEVTPGNAAASLEGK